MLTTLIITLSSCVGAATDIHANSTNSIQTSVDSANSGDVIIVAPGTYTENIVITKNDLVIRSESGNPANTIIAANDTNASVITIKDTKNVTIKGFNITGAGTNYSGIYVLKSPNCVIENNILYNDYLGVYLKTSDYTVVRNNTFSKSLLRDEGKGLNIEQSNYTNVSSNTVSNQRNGISILGSQENTLSENTVNQSAVNGIILDGTISTTLKNNNVNSNVNFGIYLSDSGSNSLINNKVFNSSNGINLVFSSGNTIQENTISDETIDSNTHAIFMNNSNNNNLQSNTVSSSDYGIAMRYSNNNNLVNNTANNNNRGIYLTLTSSMNTLSENKANSNLMNGIILSSCNNNNLVGNTATLNTFSGINLDKANNNNLTNNNASLNRKGIYISASSSGNMLSGNKANSNNGNGIILENSGDNNLTGNTAGSNTDNGIYLWSSDNSKLDSNIVSSNYRGIYLVTSNGTTISKNTVSDNTDYGMLFSLSDSNTFSRNNVSNSNRGIYLNSSKNNNVSSNNVALSSSYGLYLCAQSTSNLIFDNYLNNTINVNSQNTGCVWNKTKTSGTSIVGGPNIGGNYWANPLGIGFSQITPDANEDGIADSSYAGTNFIDHLPLVDFYVPEPVFPVADFSTNVTSGNAPLAVLFTDNSQNATSRNWTFGDGTNSTEQNPKHTYLSAGNYTVNLTVSNLNGTDSKTAVITVLEEEEDEIDVLPVANFSTNVTSGYAPLSVLFTDCSENATSRSWDVNNDGIEDSKETSFVYTYTSTGTYNANLTVRNLNGTDSKTDVITVLEKEEDENDGLPVADFSTNVTSGYVPLSVLFTDLSQDATSRSWDVNNDGIEDSTEASFVYTYTSTGTYTAKLTANNANGPATKTILIYVDRKSSGGSSGGGGGSPESSRNIEVKELSQVFISNGKAVKFDFTKAATCVVYVGFDAKKTVGKTITTAEQLKNKSSLVSELPSGEVYKSFNLWVGNGGYATEKNIENPVICFKVEKTWIQDQNIDQSSIILNRYNDKKWEQLPASLVNEDDKYLYFTAKTPGFSPFAITGKANTSQEDVTEIQPEDESDNSEENENTKSEVEQDSEQKEKPSIPGFEMIYCIIGLLGVFLHRRR